MSTESPEKQRDRVVGAFLELVGTGRLEEVRRVLAAVPQMANAVGPHPFWGGRPQPLHVAIETKRRDMFDLLLDAGADVNGTNDRYDHWSPLMIAMNRHRDDMRDELLRRGARIGLLEALLMADDGAVEKLLQPGAPALPSCAPNGGSVLSFARTPFAIDRLIELGASTDLEDRWGSTPIDAMSRMGPAGAPLVRHMVARGVHAAPQEYARLGDHRTLATLIDADPNVVRSDAVMIGAVDFGHRDLVAWLLARGGNVNARSSAQSRYTALHSAAWNGDLAMARLLVEAGADVTARDAQYDGTPAGWADTAIGIRNDPKCAEVRDYLAGVGGAHG